MYSNVRDSKPLPGSGWLFMFNSLFSHFFVFLRRLTHSRSPGRQFFFHSGYWAKGRELLRMELQRRKSAATDPFCSSSSFLQTSTSPTFPAFNFPMLFYSGCSPLREACKCMDSIHACILRSVLSPFSPVEQIPEIIPFFLDRTRHAICSEQDRMFIT